MAVLHCSDNLSKDVSCGLLSQSLLLPDVIKQLTTRDILHGNDVVVGGFETYVQEGGLKALVKFVPEKVFKCLKLIWICYHKRVLFQCACKWPIVQ